jgi:membrane protein
VTAPSSGSLVPGPDDRPTADAPVAIVRPLQRLISREDTVGALARRIAESFVVRCLLRFQRIRGRDRILVLAGQAFTAVVPLFILLAAYGSDDALARHIDDRFRLTGDAATAVDSLFARPPGSTSGLTIIGALVLFFSLLSFTRSLQRTYEAAWELPALGWRGTVDGLAAVLLLLAEVVALAVLGGLLRRVPAGRELTFLVAVPLAVVLWLQLQRLLLTRRVSRRRLLPGALAAGAGQVVAAAYSAAWMPHLMEANASRYGVIGVTFALLTWLIVVCGGVVVAAVVSGEFGRAPTAPPGLPDRSPTPGEGPPDPGP